MYQELANKLLSNNVFESEYFGRANNHYTKKDFF